MSDLSAHIRQEDTAHGQRRTWTVEASDLPGMDVEIETHRYGWARVEQAIIVTEQVRVTLANSDRDLWLAPSDAVKVRAA